MKFLKKCNVQCIRIILFPLLIGLLCILFLYYKENSIRYYAPLNSENVSSLSIVWVKVKSSTALKGGYKEPEKGQGRPISEIYKFYLKFGKRMWTPSDLGSSRHLESFWRPVEESEGNDRIISQIHWTLGLMNGEIPLKSKAKTILLMDTFRWWGFNKTRLTQDCPEIELKCTFSEEHSVREEDLNTFDAMVIIRDVFHVGRPPIRFKGTRIFYTMESPYNSVARLDKGSDLLATFWRGSDLVTPYSKWVSANESIKPELPDRNYAGGKSKLVAIFVSNCDTPNDRLQYVKTLQKYIQVDIFGRCGPEEEKSMIPAQAGFSMLKRHYKFYLAFENSNCRDYITEKLFRNAFQNDVLPVVMGAHPDDYKAIAPPNSYIHVNNFENPEALAAYLLYLDKNDEHYNSYFKWKGTGEFIEPNSLLLCRICGALHFKDIKAPPRRKEAVFLWKDSNPDLCLAPGQNYWTRF